MADGIAVEGLRLIHAALPRVMAEPKDLEARSAMMAAAMMGGAAFQKGLGLIQALVRAISPHVEGHQGMITSPLIFPVLRFNRPVIETKLEQLSATLRLPAHNADAVITWLNELMTVLAAPRSLKQLGITETQLDKIAQNTVLDPAILTNPVAANVSDVRSILEEAYSGIS